MGGRLFGDLLCLVLGLFVLLGMALGLAIGVFRFDCLRTSRFGRGWGATYGRVDRWLRK